MGAIKGAKEFSKFKKGDRLTRKEAIRAMCYDCNGADESAEDCLGVSCPMYQYRLYPDKKKGNRA